jgi:hypothetical protein
MPEMGLEIAYRIFDNDLRRLGIPEDALSQTGDAGLDTFLYMFGFHFQER